jgi:hypothetical protein
VPGPERTGWPILAHEKNSGIAPMDYKLQPDIASDFLRRNERDQGAWHRRLEMTDRQQQRPACATH